MTYRAESAPDVSGASSVMLPHPTFVLVMLLMCCVLTAIGIFPYTSYKPFVLPLTPLKVYSAGVFAVGGVAAVVAADVCCMVVCASNNESERDRGDFNLGPIRLSPMIYFSNF